MSFGWSAGDIATALAVTYNLIQALDDAYGAASNYREAVAFLGDLKRVLEPLQAFTDWSAYPTYGGEIKRQLEQIKRPVQEFLTAVLKYQPSLGEKAKRGWKRSLRTSFSKLDWYIFMEKKVLGLREKIESHMRILDTLMQRLTLDIVWKTQQELPDTLRSTLEGMIQPALIGALRECSLKIPPPSLLQNHELVMAKLSKHHELINSALDDIKKGLERPQVIQQQIQDSLLGGVDFCGQNALLGSSKSQDLPDGTHAQSCEVTPGHQKVIPALASHEESLSEVCYFILLYFLQFLERVFFALSRMVEPSRAFVSTPLAKFNITFLDAIGRPPRILPYECFQSFKILQAFIEQEFRDLPGSSWVNRGRYLILNLHNNRALDDENWNRIIASGVKIAMSMQVRMRGPVAMSSRRPRQAQCPELHCSGIWVIPRDPCWKTCPVCRKEIFTSIPGALKKSRSEMLSNGEVEGQDISSFKRFVQVRVGSKRFTPGQKSNHKFLLWKVLNLADHNASPSH